MKKIERNGAIKFVFEDDEQEARERFELAIQTPDEAEIAKIIMAIMRESRVARVEAWQSAKQMIAEIQGLNLEEKFELRYDWLQRAFVVIES